MGKYALRLAGAALAATALLWLAASAEAQNVVTGTDIVLFNTQNGTITAGTPVVDQAKTTNAFTGQPVTVGTLI
jgi:hypothetical protein